MPTYEYECQKCGYRFEKFQKMSDKPLSKCPQCKGKVKRLISAGTGLIFKGSGFFITDYKKKNISTPGKKEKQAESKNKENKPKDKGEK